MMSVIGTEFSKLSSKFTVCGTCILICRHEIGKIKIIEFGNAEIADDRDIFIDPLRILCIGINKDSGCDKNNNGSKYRQRDDQLLIKKRFLADDEINDNTHNRNYE